MPVKFAPYSKEQGTERITWSIYSGAVSVVNEWCKFRCYKNSRSSHETPVPFEMSFTNSRNLLAGKIGFHTSESGSQCLILLKIVSNSYRLLQFNNLFLSNSSKQKRVFWNTKELFSIHQNSAINQAQKHTTQPCLSSSVLFILNITL